MAIGTPVQRKAIANAALASSTWVITPDTAITAGTKAILCFSSNSNKTVTGVTDAAGNTWTVDYTFTDGTRALSFVSCQVATTISTSTNITVGLSNFASSKADLWIQEVSGLAVSSAADLHVGASGSGKNPSSGPTGVLSQASEIAFGLFRSSASSTFTRGAGFTLATTPTLDGTSALEYEITTSTAAVTANGTWGTAGSWVAAVQTYKAATGGAPVTINVPGAAVASGVSNTPPLYHDQPSPAAISSAAAPVPGPTLSVVAVVATASGAGLAPSVIITATTSVTASSAAAHATATPVSTAYGEGAYGAGSYGGGTTAPIVAISMSPAAMAATATSPAPTAIQGSGVFAVTATATSASLAPSLTFTTVVTSPVAAAAVTALVAAPTANPFPAAVTASATALVPTLTNALPVSPPVAVATASALAPSVVSTAAPVSVTATVSVASATTPLPAANPGVGAVAAHAVAIAFGGILTAPVAVVGVAPSLPAQSFANALKPILGADSIVVAATADAHADALPANPSFNLLTTAPIIDLDLDDTVEEPEGWLTTTVTTDLNLTPV